MIFFKSNARSKPRILFWFFFFNNEQDKLNVYGNCLVSDLHFLEFLSIASLLRLTEEKSF